MFTRNTFWIAEFGIAAGMSEAAKSVIRAEVLPAARAGESQLDEQIWFANDDGSRFLQFASFQTPDAAAHHHQWAQGLSAAKGFRALCESRDVKIAGPRPQKDHPLIREATGHFNEISRHEQSRRIPFGRNLFYVLELACEPRHAEAVKEMIATEFTPRVASADPDIEEYVWFMNDSRDRFLQLASYGSAEGVLIHHRTSYGTERVARLFGISRLENAKIFGVMSREVSVAYAAPLFMHYSEFARL